MHIEHIAIWCNNLELMKDFYCTYFNATASTKYFNPNKQFTSYFLQFKQGARLELMQMPGVANNVNNPLMPYRGIIHLAISVGSKEKVNALTAQLRSDGVIIIGEPRTTGDGYYESVIADPEQNLIEITE